ncbi:MAG: ABC transporter substrate-binding protein [Thermoflexales bacterium]|nr:ABC transporter substrate-binding protein [Thermoflexales bacterium]MCS7324772.1 ABC transporter substrate-binding protein [Thermoflexales bacterium]MCX7939344.1 ABC transporter substrate-binding protein [Thermoflexales bacterium]MDW8053096.1 transporter substrate-binding domain-containing protein [Anaerolineae bacterium]MDW8291749.1 transporter substrate-binding domain-containing protein [Anaerolineae bacterium]
MRRLPLLILAAAVAAAAVIALSTVRSAIIAEQKWQAFRSRGVLRVGVDPSVHPFSFFGASGWDGFEAELAKLLAKQLSVRLEAIPVGYDGLYDAMIAGYVDASMSMLTPDPLRTADFAYSRPYFDAGLRVYAPRHRLRTMDDLRGLRLAVARGSEADRLARWLERRVPRLQRNSFATDIEALAATKAGLTDGALLPAEVAIANGCPPINPADGGSCLSLHPIPYVVAVPRSEARLLEVLNRALDDLDRDGALVQLARRWFR